MPKNINSVTVLGLLGKIKFNATHDMMHIRDIFEDIISCGQCDYSKVSVSFFFRDQCLFDKIFTDTDIEYIEGATWEDVHDLERISRKDMLAANILTDKAKISINFQERESLSSPGIASLKVSKNLSLDWTRQEEEQRQIEIAELYKHVFGDISTLHFCSCFGGPSGNDVTGLLWLPADFILKGLPALLKLLSPSMIQAGYKIAINRQNQDEITAGFNRKFLEKPDGIHIDGWIFGNQYKTPFAVNSNGTLFPVRNCGFEAAFNLASYVQKNISMFHGFQIFFRDIPWRYGDKVTTADSMNSVSLSVYKNGIYLYVDYERYDDNDPLPKAIRTPMNTRLSKYGIVLKSAETVSCI